MGSLIEHLQNAVKTGEVDLSELDEMYRDDEGKPLVIPFRINWTTGQERQRYILSSELNQIRLRMGRAEEDTIEALSEAAEKNAQGWLDWWAGVFMVELEEVRELQDALPPAHWEWLTAKIIELEQQYRQAETKKVLAVPSRTSEEKADSPQKSTSESG